jgi:hypothetical protein
MSEVNATKPVLSKEEKLAKINEQIAKLQARYDDVLNDRAPVKAAKVVIIPEVGAKVIATIGRATATTQPSLEEGTVVAVKRPADGEKGAVQLRVRIKEGQFEEQLVTLYVAQVEIVREEEAA